MKMNFKFIASFYSMRTEFVYHIRKIQLKLNKFQKKKFLTFLAFILELSIYF